MQLKKEQRFLVILILGLLSTIGPFAIDMYLPGFPAIADYFDVSVDQVTYSISSYFIGVCIGQMICGPLLDRFGRKGPLFIGLGLFIASSLACATATTIEALIVFRFFQALGGCVGMVAPRAIVRDLFPVEENAKIFSFLILVLGVSPLLAPTIGSLVIAKFGWSYVFIVLAVITSLIVVGVIFWLPESKPADPTFSLKPKPIITNFWTVMREPQFYTYALAGGVASAGLFAYVGGSPFVFMKLYGVSEQQYGLIFALIASGLIISSQINNALLNRFSSEKIMMAVIIIQTSVGLIFFVGSLFDVLGLFSTIGLIFVFLSCQGFSFPNSAALSMAPFSKEAGSASALMGAFQMGFGSLASAAVGMLNAQSAKPLAGVMTGCAFIGLIILLVGRKGIVIKPKISDVKDEAFELIEKV